MFDLDKWKEIWATLRANRLRTFLTAFGVFWGIVMLMAMLAFGSAMQTGMQRQMRGMATNMMFIWGQQTSESYDGLPVGRAVRFDLDDIPLLRKLPQIEYLAPRISLGGWMSNTLVVRNGKSGTFGVMGDYPEMRNIVAFEYSAGRFINDRDIAERRKVVVIGSAAKDVLFPDPAEEPIGQYIQINGVYFEVIGITKTLRSGQMGDRDANTLFVPFSTMKTAFNTGNHVGFFALTAAPGTDGDEFERAVRATLAHHHDVSPTDQLAFGSFNMFEKFAGFQTFLTVLRLLAWVVGVATLLAGAIGVSNIMLITVKERTKEIGVRKALGATPMSVISMVMKESIVLTLVAGLIGIAVGTGIIALADVIFSQLPQSPLGPPVVTIKTIAIALAVLVGAGALAGLMPASHAASIKPIEALRAE